MSTTEKLEEGFVARDFVYCGKRLGDKDKPFVVIRQILEDGTLGDQQFYEYNKKRDRIVGAVYSGAQFSDSLSKGLDAVRFVKQWHDREDRIEWQAKDEAVEVTLRRNKLEKDTGRISEIEQMLLPLRKQYENLRFRHDFAGAEALEKAVLRALKSAPRVIE